MADPIITLTTDFGEDSPYVAAMKGVILGLNPQVRLLDLSHQVPPQDVRHAAFFLRHAIPYFPPGVIHVVVIDPGVGSERALLYVNVGGHRLVAPDNGCWTQLPGGDSPTVEVLRLAEPAYWRQPVSATFHGRDILAPVAGHLSLGLDHRQLGYPVADWVRLTETPPRQAAGAWWGEVVFVDHFGNLITNIPGAGLPTPPARVVIQVGDVELGLPRVRTYAEAAPGTLAALVSSAGTLEVAIPHGSAAQRLRARAGAVVRVIVDP